MIWQDCAQALTPLFAGDSRYMSATEKTDAESPADNQSPAALQPAFAHSLVRGPDNIRNASLVLIAVNAVVFSLYLGSSVSIPVVLAIVLSCALSPVVNVLHKRKIPRAVGAALVLLGIVGGAGSLA
jgi:hypothetical protein